MFDIGFSEIVLVMIVGLVVLGPERLPVAVKTVAGWIRAMRTLASSVQNELTQELKLQELQDSLKNVEKAGLQNLTPELKSSMDELRDAANALKRSYQDEITPAVDAEQKTEPQQIAEPKVLQDVASAPVKPAVAESTPSVAHIANTANASETAEAIAEATSVKSSSSNKSGSES